MDEENVASTVQVGSAASTGTSVTDTVNQAIQNNLQDVVDPAFTKEQILNSKKYMHNKDLVNALLEKDKTYLLENVDKILKDFLEGAVK